MEETTSAAPRLARFASLCSRCRKWINDGSPIYGTPVTHATVQDCETAQGSVTWTPLDGPERERLTGEAAALLHAAPWRFAKTMPDSPHWYSLRREWRDPAAFTLAVAHIHRLAVRRAKWRTASYHYLDLGEFSYWLMEPRHAPAEATTVLINRAVRVQP